MRILKIIIIAAFSLLLALAFSRQAHAKDITEGPVACELISVYDGDTFKCWAAPWPDVRIRTSVRPAGFDTPEIRGKCVAEKARAIIARNVLIEWLNSGPITLRNVELWKWAGRVGAEVRVGGIPIEDVMIKSGVARAYDGGARGSWCDGGQPVN